MRMRGRLFALLLSLSFARSFASFSRLVHVALGLAFVACAGSGDAPVESDAGIPPLVTPDGGNASDASSLTTEEACKANAAGYCQHLEQCFPFSIRANWGDVATCTATVAPACAQVLTAPNDGWTPDRLATCVKAREALTCERFLFRKPELAECTILGAIDDGAACRYGPQCKSGYCKISTGVCGNCVAPAVRGGACTTYSDCAGALLCAKNNTCQPAIEVSGACDDTHPCALGTACIAAQCKAPAIEGSDCDPALGGIDCDYYQQLYCQGATKKCTKYKVVKAGEPCAVPNDAIVCEAGGGCLNGTCAAAGTAGTLCDPSKGITCAYPLTCDAGTCRLIDPSECR
jgi:hypothetical protein